MQPHNYILYIVCGETRTGTTAATTFNFIVVFVVTVLVTLQIVEPRRKKARWDLCSWS